MIRLFKHTRGSSGFAIPPIRRFSAPDAFATLNILGTGRFYRFTIFGILAHYLLAHFTILGRLLILPFLTRLAPCGFYHFTSFTIFARLPISPAHQLTDRLNNDCFID